MTLSFGQLAGSLPAGGVARKSTERKYDGTGCGPCSAEMSFDLAVVAIARSFQAALSLPDAPSSLVRRTAHGRADRICGLS